MVVVRKRDGGGGGVVEEEEGVYSVLDANNFNPKSVTYHKNLSPTNSIDSVDSDQSSVSSAQDEDLKLGRRESTDSACDTESCNHTDNSTSDEEPQVFEKEDLTSDVINEKLGGSQDSACGGSIPKSKKWASKISTRHKKPTQEISTSQAQMNPEIPMHQAQSIPEMSTQAQSSTETGTIYSFGRSMSYFGTPDLNSNTKDDQGYGFQSDFEPEEKSRPEVGPQASVYTSGEWVRPLGKFEMVMATGGYYGTLNTIQALRIVSPEPIKPEAVRHAVTILARRTEMLQVSVIRSALWLWFYRMKYVRVPFRTEDYTGDIMQIYYDLLHKPYNMSRGPLWRVRLVPEPKTSDGLHQAVLMFAIHHCITDAFTNMLLCKETLKILNASLTGQVYMPQLRPIPPNVGDELVSASDLFHATKFAIYKFYSSTVGNYNKSVYFNGAFPQPATTEVKTRILHAELTEEATRRLLRQCKVNGATVHATIMTLVQLAMVSVADERSNSQESDANIRVFNCVNMRRYFPEEHRDAPGCYISIEEQETHIDMKDAQTPTELWSLIGKVHKNLNSSLNKGMPVKNQPGLLPCALLIPINNALTTRGKCNLNDNHIVSTNMGDLRDLLPEQCGEGPVRITHLLRCVSDELTGHPYTIVFHTFLNRFSFGLEYYTNKTDENLAQQFFNRLSDHISDVASFGAIRTEELDRSGNFHSDKF